MWPRIFSGWCFNYDDDYYYYYYYYDNGDDLPDNIEIPKEDAAKSDAEDKNMSSDGIITCVFDISIQQT